MNSVVKLNPFAAAPQPAAGWVWDGSQWICCPPCDGVPPFPCPPPGFPPPGCPPWFSGMNSPPWYPGANAGVSFGTTAPLNPVRGHFWWDGRTEWLFDGAAWVPVGGNISGALTPPSTTAPANPQPGQQWFNGSTLFVWDGNAWIPVSQTKTFIQATAPPAPNPGDLWYDGTQMHIWDGSAWELVGPGAFVGPVGTTSDVFNLTASANITISAGWSIVNIPTGVAPITDTMHAWDPTTHRITPTKAGVYAAFTSSYYGGAATSGGHALVKNDTGTFNTTSQMNVTFSSEATAPGTVSAYLNGFGMVKMNGTTDFLRLWGFNDAGTFYVNPGQPLIHLFLLP